MEEKIRRLIERYKKDIEFYESVGDKDFVKACKWIVEDLEKLLGDSDD